MEFFDESIKGGAFDTEEPGGVLAEAFGGGEGGADARFGDAVEAFGKSKRGYIVRSWCLERGI